jgi:hypothetical protein
MANGAFERLTWIETGHLAHLEELCFSNASSFSRAFRALFGHSAREVRSAAAGGLVLPATREMVVAAGRPNFNALFQES